MASRTIGIVGLGRMGMQIARRLHRKKHKIFAWNRNPKKRAAFKKFGGRTADTIEELVNVLAKPRIVWIMLPSGQTTAEMLERLHKLLQRGDIVIDGSNSFYEDSIKRAKLFEKKGIYFFDSGTSGGIHGEKNGFSLMVGGNKKVWPKVEPIFKDLAAESSSYGLVGGAGSGHFVKMVHNGIEYGMMEAIAEGFAVINKWNSKIDLADVSKIWQKGAVVSSWLIDLARDIFEKEDLSRVVGYVRHTGEGEWTIKTAKKLGVDVRVIEDALKVRKESENKANQKLLRNKILALLRNRFGGHEVLRRK